MLISKSSITCFCFFKISTISFHIHTQKIKPYMKYGFIKLFQVLKRLIFNYAPCVIHNHGPVPSPAPQTHPTVEQPHTASRVPINPDQRKPPTVIFDPFVWSKICSYTWRRSDVEPPHQHTTTHQKIFPCNTPHAFARPSEHGPCC